MTTLIVTFGLDEFCRSTNLSRDVLVEIVELGILEPREPDVEPWSFDETALILARRAVRLKQDFELDWPGIALAIRLLDELEQVKRENRRLRQRLERFTPL
ncbi:chaperone modulator CbpM [Pseudomonas mangiferae]|uniref:Chaperone modulatory protein CbpM n=1 Tax=Pseudomonas mangiferae TaxID=2593654 RepID=A0A553H3I4_9PSED|nr:chaperone modulator CbpM [Pseudomonas mangiferae]TRX76298.1 chaperone modulatory protein CbpM [Pseudomonas mangiferae]